MRIVVTGHRGFIGSRVASRLETLGHEVNRIDGDLRDAPLPLAEGYMHFAAKMGGVGYFTSQQFTPILDNLLMDARIIRHCRESGARLLFPSSACAYPVYLMEQGEPLSETLLQSYADPDQMYGLEKYMITRLAEHSDFDLRVPILHTVYGEGQEFASEKVKFPPQICYKFCRPEPIEVWGDGTQTRTFLYIDDAVDMLLEIFFADKYHGAVNVSHPSEVSVRTVVDILASVTGRADISYNTSKPTGPSRRPVDNTKFYSLYSAKPRVDAEEGFRRLYESIKNKVTVDTTRGLL